MQATNTNKRKRTDTAAKPAGGIPQEELSSLAEVVADEDIFGEEETSDEDIRQPIETLSMQMDANAQAREEQLDDFNAPFMLLLTFNALLTILVKIKDGNGYRLLLRIFFTGPKAQVEADFASAQRIKHPLAAEVKYAYDPRTPLTFHRVIFLINKLTKELFVELFRAAAASSKASVKPTLISVMFSSERIAVAYVSSLDEFRMICRARPMQRLVHTTTDAAGEKSVAGYALLCPSLCQSNDARVARMQISAIPQMMGEKEVAATIFKAHPTLPRANLISFGLIRDRASNMSRKFGFANILVHENEVEKMYACSKGEVDRIEAAKKQGVSAADIRDSATCPFKYLPARRTVKKSATKGAASKAPAPPAPPARALPTPAYTIPTAVVGNVPSAQNAPSSPYAPPHTPVSLL